MNGSFLEYCEALAGRLTEQGSSHEFSFGVSDLLADKDKDAFADLDTFLDPSNVDKVRKEFYAEINKYSNRSAYKSQLDFVRKRIKDLENIDALKVKYESERANLLEKIELDNELYEDSLTRNQDPAFGIPNHSEDLMNKKKEDEAKLAQLDKEYNETLEDKKSKYSQNISQIRSDYDDLVARRDNLEKEVQELLQIRNDSWNTYVLVNAAHRMKKNDVKKMVDLAEKISVAENSVKSLEESYNVDKDPATKELIDKKKAELDKLVSKTNILGDVENYKDRLEIAKKVYENYDELVKEDLSEVKAMHFDVNNHRYERIKKELSSVKRQINRKSKLLDLDLGNFDSLESLKSYENQLELISLASEKVDNKDAYYKETAKDILRKELIELAKVDSKKAKETADKLHIEIPVVDIKKENREENQPEQKEEQPDQKENQPDQKENQPDQKDDSNKIRVMDRIAHLCLNITPAKPSLIDKLLGPELQNKIANRVANLVKDHQVRKQNNLTREQLNELRKDRSSEEYQRALENAREKRVDEEVFVTKDMANREFKELEEKSSEETLKAYSFIKDKSDEEIKNIHDRLELFLVLKGKTLGDVKRYRNTLELADRIKTMSEEEIKELGSDKYNGNIRKYDIVNNAYKPAQAALKVVLGKAMETGKAEDCAYIKSSEELDEFVMNWKTLKKAYENINSKEEVMNPKLDESVNYLHDKFEEWHLDDNFTVKPLGPATRRQAYDDLVEIKDDKVTVKDPHSTLEIFDSVFDSNTKKIYPPSPIMSLDVLEDAIELKAKVDEQINEVRNAIENSDNNRYTIEVEDTVKGKSRR